MKCTDILKKISDLLKKIKRMSQIQNIENLIGIDSQLCPSKKNNITIEQARADILSYLREEEYANDNDKLKRLEDAKNIIQEEIDEKLLGTLNSYSNEPAKKSREQEVADSLLSLDYRIQENEFTFPFYSSNKKGAFFLLEEDEEIIRDWLVFRLAIKYKAKIFSPIDFRYHPNIPKQGFQAAFYNEFKLDREGLIEKFLHILLYEKQSVFIVAHGIRCYRFISTIQLVLQELYNFFSDLLCSFQKRAKSKNLTSRIIFILVERKSDAAGRFYLHFKNETEDNNIIKALTVLEEIPNCAVSEWLDSSESFEIFKQSNFYDLKSVKNKFSSCFTDEEDKLSPLIKLDCICSQLFDLKSADAIKEYWELKSICN